MSDDILIDSETAENEFQRFVDMMGLDVDEDHMDKDDLKSFHKLKRRILVYIQRGHVVVNETGEIEFRKFPRSPKIEASSLVFHEPGGDAFMSMDSKEDGHNVAKMHAIMATMTKRPAAMFSNVVGMDYKVMQAIVTLFLD